MEDFLEEYLLGVPPKLLTILSQRFYFYGRPDSTQPEWTIPWTFSEVTAALEIMKKSYF
jgi:hypothetical protein